MSDFQLAKLALVDALGLAKDALHVHFGLAVFLGVALAVRRPLSHWLPLAAAFAAALAGEAWDLLDTVRAGEPVAWRASWRDVANTVFWPLALFLLARRTRLLRR